MQEFGTLVEIYLGQRNLGLRYYAKIEDAPINGLLRQYIINTDNQLMVFYGSIWNGCTDIDRSTGVYIVLYQGGLINNCTHVPGSADQ